MRCASWGREPPPEKPHEPLDWAALGLADQEVSCPAYPSDPQQQATPAISAAAWLGQWVEDNALENRLHHVAKQQGFQRGTPRHRDARASDSGRDGLATAEQDGAQRDGNLPVKLAKAITLGEGENCPVYGTIRAEIIEYSAKPTGRCSSRT